MFERILKEPLLHFVLIGAALFWVYGYVSRGQDAGDRRIVIDDGTIATLIQTFQGTWQRPPSVDEMRGLLDTHIRDQILYREGVLMGLDRDDPVIRRRVIQKLSVITEESAAAAPTEAELEDYLSRNAAKYSKPPIFDIEQVMFDPVRHGNQTEAKMAAALKALMSGADPAETGDSTLLPTVSAATPADRLESDFGADFVKVLMDLPVGSWQGPVRSGFGLHLVRIVKRTPGAPLALADTRAAVTRDLENERRLKAAEDFYQKAKLNYSFVIEADLPENAKPKLN